MARGQLIFDQPEQKPEDEISEALAVWGLMLDTSNSHELEETFYLWPDCMDAFRLWHAVQTQWQVGMGGATGLNYAGVQACMTLRAIPAKKRPELFDYLQAMETATLSEWNKKK